MGGNGKSRLVVCRLEPNLDLSCPFAHLLRARIYPSRPSRHHGDTRRPFPSSDRPIGSSGHRLQLSPRPACAHPARPYPLLAPALASQGSAADRGGSGKGRRLGRIFGKSRHSIKSLSWTVGRMGGQVGVRVGRTARWRGQLGPSPTASHLAAESLDGLGRLALCRM